LNEADGTYGYRAAFETHYIGTECFRKLRIRLGQKHPKHCSIIQSDAVLLCIFNSRFGKGPCVNVEALICFFFLHRSHKNLEVSPAYEVVFSVPLAFNQDFLAVLPSYSIFSSIIRERRLLNPVSETFEQFRDCILKLSRCHG
jgi:hypothetical protein